jgi:hypothetical protein
MGKLEDVLDSLKLGYSDNGSKDLLLDDLHVLTNVSKNGWLDEVALALNAVATSDDTSTVLLALFNLAEDSVELNL